MPRNFERNDQISAKNVHSAAPPAVGRWRAIRGRGLGVPARGRARQEQDAAVGSLPGGSPGGLPPRGARREAAGRGRLDAPGLARKPPARELARGGVKTGEAGISRG